MEFRNAKFLFLLLSSLVTSNSQAQVTIPKLDSTTLFTYTWTVFKMPGINLYNIDWSKFPSIQFYPGNTIKVKGSLGSNPFEGEAYLDDKNNLRFSVKPGRDFVGSESYIDTKFLNSLDQIDKYKIQNNELRFFSKGVLLVKLTPNMDQDSPYPLLCLNGDWKVESISTNHGFADTYQQLQPTLTFHLASPDSLLGFTGCRHFIGAIKLGISRIALSKLHVSNDSLCTNKIEGLLFEKLNQLNSFVLGNDILYLKNGGTVTVMLRRSESISMTKGQAIRFRDRKNKRNVGVCVN